MKAKILGVYKLVLGVIFSLLGISGCGEKQNPDEYEELLCAYGPPIYTMVFSGNVKDEAGKPISGIKVTYLEKSWGGSPPHVDTFYVNQSVLNTRFDGSIPRDTFWTIMSMPKVDRGNIKVLFEDEDGEENGGKFQRDSINGNQMKIEEIRSYMYSVSFDKQLKKEK